MLKQHIFTYLLTTLSFSFLFSQEEEDIKGDVKTVTQVSYELAVNNDSDSSKGREINYESVAHYNREGLIREHLSFYDADTTFTTYHYDKGELVEIHYYRKDRDHNKTEIRYNENGEIKARIFTDLLKDTISWIEIYRYDDNDKLIEIGVTDVNGNLKTLYKFDEAGNKVERIYSWGKVKCKYDSLGREVEMRIYDRDEGLTSTRINNYEGDLLKERYLINTQGEVEFKSKYEYANIDKEGNWLKKTIFSDGEFEDSTTKTIVIREIEYYD